MLRNNICSFDNGIVLLKAGGQILQEERDLLIQCVLSLHRLHLKVILVHGAGDELSRELHELGIG